METISISFTKQVSTREEAEAFISDVKAILAGKVDSVNINENYQEQM